MLGKKKRRIQMSKPKLPNRKQLRTKLLQLYSVVPQNTDYCYRCKYRKFIGYRVNIYGERYKLIKCKLTNVSTKNEYFLLWDSCKVCGVR